MIEITKHINDTNASYRDPSAGDAKNTDLFLDNEQYQLFQGMGNQITVRLNKSNLAQSILFIASILPRKYDSSAVHKRISYSRSFIEEQLDILDGYFQVEGKPVETITQKWNVRINVPKKNGEIDSRFYFNGILQDFSYFDKDSNLHKAKFTIRNYLAGSYSNLHIRKGKDNIFDVWITNAVLPLNDGKEDGLEELEHKAFPNSPHPLQVIYYGAPGTGKSHAIKELTEGKRVIRTTFHPDSDYSTFVGAYKPTTVDDPVMTVIGTKAVPVENPDGTDRTEKKIVYEFVPQAFLQAYVNAWLDCANAKDGEEAEEQYLVIEEINRGNCAQIFGDLFQLLDRNDDGYSEYPINADKDMEKYLSEAFEKIAIPGEDKLSEMFKDPYIAQKIGLGKVLVLPPNLHIWATMNTSDQSLFPIDSAFKRRWEWKYIPISEGIDKQTHTTLGWKLRVNGKSYDWWAFLQAINEQIGGLTKSQDKKLGYFFCKAKGGVIDAETLVGKVLFFLWNEVLKDFQEDQPFLNDGNGGNLAFDDFYAVDAGGKAVVQEDKVERLLANLEVKPLTDESSSESADEGRDGGENEARQTDETGDV